MIMRVADLHCDLLWFLSKDKTRTPFDAESQASIPLMKEGKVALQVFPIYTTTDSDSAVQGATQFQIYDQWSQHEITSRMAIENASSFCDEEEPIEKGLERLAAWHQKHPLVYISLTWNEENRFGGGAETQVGLKEDGKRLLQWMSGQHIAVDLSHASDPLAHEILEAISSHSITPIASHSNFRSVCSHSRNLPDAIAQKIVQRGGVIGMNLVRHFLGLNGPEDLLAHVEHAHALGIEKSLCLGADFFPEVDVDERKAHLKPYFFDQFSTSACYPRLRQLLLSKFSEPFVNHLMYDRLIQFLESL